MMISGFTPSESQDGLNWVQRNVPCRCSSKPEALTSFILRQMCPIIKEPEVH